MELMDSSLDKLYQMVYHQLKQSFPEKILAKMAVAVSFSLMIVGINYRCLLVLSIAMAYDC